MTAGLTQWQQEWLGHLEECDASGLTSIEYARRHGIDVQRLYWSRAELRKRGLYSPKSAGEPGRKASPKFVRAALPAMDVPLRAELANGVVLTIGVGVDEATLRTAVNVLGAI